MRLGTVSERLAAARTSLLRRGSVLLLAGILLQPQLGWPLPPSLSPPESGSARAPQGESIGSPLTLREAIKTALRLHPQVRAAHYSQAVAQANAGQAMAPWLPQLVGGAQLRGDYSDQFGGPPADKPTESTRSTKLLYSSQLQLNQLLYDFGRTGGSIASSRAAARAAGWDEQVVRAQVALAAATAYYGVLQAEALTGVTERNLEQQQQRLRQAASFFHIGTRPGINVLIAKTALAQAELQRVQARNNTLTARAQLLQSLGVTDPDWLMRPLVSTVPAALPAESTPLPQLLEATLRQRPDYYALRERVTQAEQQLRASRGAYFPVLTLSATAGINGSALGGSSGGATSSSGIATAAPGFGVTGIVGMSWPLFNGLNNFFTVRVANAALEVAKANLETLRQQVRGQLQVASIALGTARESEAAATVVLQQAEKQSEMATGRYGAGVGSAIEVGDAQVTAMTARAQRVQTQYLLALARANFEWQLGVLVQNQVAQPGNGERGQVHP